jgi:4-amino-4-deoxy-L-arabinose transferase-like glycosyltransferase
VTSSQSTPIIRPNPLASEKMRGSDYLLLLVLCAALYGWSAISGRPLTMHEARLPELAREMLQTGQWLLPQSGGRPWLERPPLPHWFIAGSDAIFGRTDREWIVRFPSAVMGACIVLLVAWMAGRHFGRTIGLLGGAAMATMFELYQYASLAEDDIYLAAIVCLAMALFVKAEFSEGEEPPPVSAKSLLVRFFTWRRWEVLGLFVLLGLSNLVKGPLVGTVPVVATVGVFLMGQRKLSRISRYIWLWGWIVFLILAIAWPYLAWRRYPGIWDNWMYDYRGQGEENFQFAKPWWHYLLMLPGYALLPWTLFAFIGLFATARAAWHRRSGFERFLWCWAIVPIVVLSIPGRKHHHYLVPVLAPWGILSGIGLFEASKVLFNGKGPEWSRRPWFGLLVFGLPGAIALGAFARWIPGPTWVTIGLAGVWLVCVWLFYVGLSGRRGGVVMASLLLGMVVAYGWAQSIAAPSSDNTAADMRFLRQVNRLVPSGEPLMINAATYTLDFFRLQFYLPADARLLHNLTFLRDQNITSPQVYVITRARDESALRQLGTVREIVQSEKTRRETSPLDRFTLYKLIFDPHLRRYAVPEHIGVMEAMQRKEGPFCGPPLE